MGGVRCEENSRLAGRYDIKYLEQFGPVLTCRTEKTALNLFPVGGDQYQVVWTFRHVSLLR